MKFYDVLKHMLENEYKFRLPYWHPRVFVFYVSHVTLKEAEGDKYYSVGEKRISAKYPNFLEFYPRHTPIVPQVSLCIHGSSGFVFSWNPNMGEILAEEWEIVNNWKEL